MHVKTQIMLIIMAVGLICWLAAKFLETMG
jgi:hypothetical protein